MSYVTKTYTKQGGDRITVATGGSLKIGNAVLAANAQGRIVITGLPTSNPNQAGALWSNSGVLTVSAG